MLNRIPFLADFLHDWHWPTFWRMFAAMVLSVSFIMAVPGLRPDLSSHAFQALGIARDHLFDFANWEASAVLDKTLNRAVGLHLYMTAEDRVEYVGDYLQIVYDIAQLEIQVQDLYVDPSITDPEAVSADLRAQRDVLRADQRERQALAEAIIQSQVSEMLVEQGFGMGGWLLPPVAIRFTELPTILIISPRDRIERTASYPLEHGMTVDEMERVEKGVDAELDVSSLIVPLGGLAVYPAMLIETGYAPHVYDIGAHEWAHHYLSFYPLGFNYGQTPELYTINETVASIVGADIGWMVLDRYYPEFAPAPPDYTPQPPQEPPPLPGEAPAFDFRDEMHATRVRVDELLAEGKIEEAERYMEERRILFVEQGYRIRKINQAYFAFYGAYADQPGATGADPIGPVIRELRFYSGSLHEFIRIVRGVTTFDELKAALELAKRRYHEAGR